MDDGTEVKRYPNTPWEDLEIDHEDHVFRSIIATQRQGKKPNEYPPEGHFELRDDELSLSFKLGRFVNEESCYHLIGLSHGKKGKLLDITSFKIFKYEVGFLQTLPKFEKIDYEPVYNGSPSPLGSPNDKSHVSLFCDDFSVSVRAALSDYCVKNIDYCKCEVDIKTLREDVEELKKKDQNTPYHKDWNFEGFNIK